MQNYVLITPAHNEEAFIEGTITSVLAQSVQPVKWVIVNDASTDGTQSIVESYASRHSFIQLVNVQRAEGRHFGNKTTAFNRGLAEISDVAFHYVGNLDADIVLEPDYFENMLREFGRDPRLGIAGGIVFTKAGERFVTEDRALDSVAGAVQLFSRECFDEIGGYMTLPGGGMDTAAEIIARMRGWKVRKFPENRVFEHRRTGTARATPLGSRIKEGRQFHSLGYGPFFYLCRCLYRLTDRPFVLGSAAAFGGYFASMIRGRRIELCPETVRYLRTEQTGKLKRLVGLCR